jgi:PspA-Associated protein
MIVRISTEGQYELGEDAVAELNELDNAAVVACETADDGQFHEAFGRMLDFIRSSGRRLGDDDLEGSDLILPPPDVTLAEARAEFTGEGLLPG